MRGRRALEPTLCAESTFRSPVRVNSAWVDSGPAPLNRLRGPLGRTATDLDSVDLISIAKEFQIRSIDLPLSVKIT